MFPSPYESLSPGVKGPLREADRLIPTPPSAYTSRGVQSAYRRAMGWTTEGSEFEPW
jgi:hypothetical protein